MVCVLIFLLLALSSGLIQTQETELVEVFTGDDAIPSPNEATGRTFGTFANFDAVSWKENLLHKKISFLFSIFPRPNKWNYSPYPGAFPGGPGLPGAFPGGPGLPGPFPGAFPQGLPPQFIPPNGPYGPPFGGGIVPGAGGGYPGFNNPYYPPGPGGFFPGILPVVAENATNPAAVGGGKPPSQSAAVAGPAAATTTTAAPAASGGEEEEAPAEEEGKRRKTIKMMPKSFKLN